MKKTLFVLSLAVVMMVALVPSAFALHGAYNSTGASCRECHQVHDAEVGTGTNTALFIKATGPYQTNTGTGGTGIAPASGYTNSNTEALCEYCHVYGGHVIDQVYGAGVQGNASTMAAHKIGETVIPNSSGAYTLVGNGTAGGLGCTDCHNALPHAAKSGKTWTNGNSTLMLPDPAGVSKSMYTQVTGADLTPYGGSATNQFCARCHDENMSLNLGGTTHILTSATTMNTTNYGSGVTVAWNGSETCVKCHAVNEFHSLQQVAGTTKAADGALGSYTALTGSAAPVGTKPFQSFSTEATGTDFTVWGLGLGYNGPGSYKAEGVADGLCISCHMKSDSSEGVGVSF